MKKSHSPSTETTGENAVDREQPAEIVSRTDDGFTLQVYIPYSHSMLKAEELIQIRVNECGVVATEDALKRFDTDGSAIEFGGERFTSKGREAKTYQTPYGPTVVSDHGTGV